MSDATRLLAKAGKTFYFATMWLDKSTRYDAAIAYAFCRTVDDIADGDLDQKTRDRLLNDIAQAVVGFDFSHELVKPLEQILSRHPQIAEPLAALVQACRQDTASLIINSEQDLERYAFGVAGNVGLIMYPILGGKLAVGREYAAQLGMAMQATNIARDVVEDLERNRIYIPNAWMDRSDLRQLLVRNIRCEQAVVEAVRKMLRWADERYSRGLSGLCYLAQPNRFAIKVAARCYAAIGDSVIVRGRLSRARATVSTGRKIALACQAGLQMIREPEHHK